MSKWASQDQFRIHEQVHAAADGNPAKVDTISAEIFLKVVEHLQTAKDLSNLSKTSKRFRDLVGRDGWRVFVQINFPSLFTGLQLGIENNSIDWRALAHSLTTQSRAWDRRAISTVIWSERYFDPRLLQFLRLKNGIQPDFKGEQFISEKENHFSLLQWDEASQKLSSFRISGGLSVGGGGEAQQLPSSRRQSTPFHPAIDTRLEFSGKLSSKKQTIAWSTGREVFVQVCRSGSFLPRLEDDPYDHYLTLDEYSNYLDSFAILHDEFRSGVDDVTSIHILDPSTQIRVASPEMLAVDLIIGRASGHLHRYSVSNAEPVRVVVNTFHSFEREGSSSRRSLRSADVNSKKRASLLAACSDKVISLYKTEVETHDVWPVAEFNIELELPSAQAWTTKFSSHENLLLGLGQSEWPLHAYKATPTGLVLTEKFGNHCDTADWSELASNSVYAIEPVSGVSWAGGSSDGDVFLTGCYDGVCRLYDRRAGCSSVRSFYDSIETEFAIYSLASFGQERFLAGSANSILKIFDFRNGCKVYHHTDGLPCSIESPVPNASFNSTNWAEGRKYNPHIQSIRHKGVEKCHYDFRTDVAQTCHFHTLSRMDIHRPNASIFLYGAPRGSNPRTRAVSRHERSPIFSISSPDPISPVVYAGTTGMVYELEISEMNQSGDVPDPYFAAPPGAGLAKRTEELVMYEMDGSDTAHVTNGFPVSLWVLPNGPRIGNSAMATKESRLDARWRSKA